MTRVLFISDTLRQRFGVTAVAMNYFRNIDKQRIRIDFLIFSDSEKVLVDEIKASGSDVFFMPKLGLSNISEYVFFMNDFFGSHNYNIIHSHFNQIDSIVFPIAKKYSKVTCISHSHNTKYSDSKFKSIRNWLMCLPIKKQADRWFACSELAGVFLYGKQFRSSPKSYVMRNAINCNKFAFDETARYEIRKEFGFTDQIVIGNIGSFKLQKNQSFLLDIFYELTKKDNSHSYKLLLIGDGKLKESLKTKASLLGIENNIIFTGQRSDVNKLLQGIDVFVLPSLYEGLPVIGIEAQASGLPCLFSNTITKEVGICNDHFIPINKGTDIWVDKIITISDFLRKDVTEIVRQKGYSIIDAANEVASYYERL